MRYEWVWRLEAAWSRKSGGSWGERKRREWKAIRAENKSRPTLGRVGKIGIVKTAREPGGSAQERKNRNSQATWRGADGTFSRWG